jgi:ectoine hydroxylase-related dioxygenase (phytanoyl-CoA dioxygenase family)
LFVEEAVTSTSTQPELELQEPYVLPPGSAERYEADGFVHLSDVVSAAVIEAYEPEITGQVIELNTNHLPMSERDTYSKAFLQVTNLWQHSAKVEELVRSPRLAQIAADLLGVRGVRLYHDQALYKEPGGGITPWHADGYYWPLATDRCCTIWLPLQETPKALGPLTFARGSHTIDYGRDLPISDQSEEELQAMIDEQGFDIVEEPFALGDASYHSGWTFHHASPNVSDQPRRVMTIIYVDADMEIAQPVNPAQVNDLAGWLGARPVGSKVGGPLNPVLYEREPTSG